MVKRRTHSTRIRTTKDDQEDQVHVHPVSTRTKGLVRRKESEYSLQQKDNDKT